VNIRIQILKSDAYSNALYMYGFYVLCYLIDEYEASEKYEECHLITEAIKKHNRLHDVNLPTRIGDDCDKQYHNAFKKLGLNVTYVKLNLSHYIDKVKEMAHIKLAQPL